MVTLRHKLRIPRSGPEREALRQKGQFWTPSWVADAMVAYVLSDLPPSIFDPAVGTGVFLAAAKMRARRAKHPIRLLGSEVDPAMLREARAQGLDAEDLAGVERRDFVLNPPKGPFPAIVANPPYIRHHRLSDDTKRALQAHLRQLGLRLDGRAGLHVHFLVRALELLAPGGRLAFIMPADTVEGVSAADLWQWITSRFRLEAVINFTHTATPFPGVDTNPLIFMIRNLRPACCVRWARCNLAGGTHLTCWVTSGFPLNHQPGLEVHVRELSEILRTGLSRPPLPTEAEFHLGDFAMVRRGIATGANDFFHLTAAKAHELGIPPQYLVPAIGRTRDVQGNAVTRKTLRDLDEAGRPTLLLSLDGHPIDSLPSPIQDYIRTGEQMGLHKRPLIAMRRPWYKMEVRRVPPILFAYLGRRNARFIRNLAGIRPLTGFLCVYPKRGDLVFVDRLWKTLSHPETINNLVLVAKSYGGGAIKVEPRALERLPLPAAALRASGLASAVVQSRRRNELPR